MIQFTLIWSKISKI